MRCLWVVAVFSILVGCGNGQLKQTLDDHNNRVEYLLSSYERAVSQGEFYEGVVREYLQTGLLGVEDGVLEESKKHLENMKASLDSFIEREQNLILNAPTYHDREDSFEYERVTPDHISAEDVIKDALDIYYLLEDSTGRTYQMFVLQLGNGYIGGFQIVWLGNELLGVENLF